MALSLLKRLIKGSPLTHAEGDNNLSLIETEVNGKAPISHTHTIAQILTLQATLDALDAATAGAASAAAVAAALALKIDLTEKGANNGVATLGASGIIPKAQMGIAGKVVAMGRTLLSAGTSVSIVEPAWKQNGGGDTQLILSYDRADSLTNTGVLHPAATTANNTTFIIKSTNGSDGNWVNWVIINVA